MKDHYEKIFDIVVKRGDERLKRKKIIMSRCTHVAFSVAGLCAALIVGFSIWHNKDINDLISRNKDDMEIVSESSTVSVTNSITADVTSGMVASQVTETIIVTTQTQTVTSVQTSPSAQTSSDAQAVVVAAVTPSQPITTSVTQTATSVSFSTTEPTSSEEQAVSITAGTPVKPQTTSITQTAAITQPPQTTSAAVISDIEIYRPDEETIRSKFSEICLDDGVVYRLQYTDIDASVIGAKKGNNKFTSDDKNKNIRYVIDAEIFDVPVESSPKMIAVKFEGIDDIYIYYAVTDDVFSMDRVNFNVRFGKYEYGYVSCGIQRVNEEKIGKFLDKIILNGKNDFTGENIQFSGKVYEIENISPDCALAVMYDNDPEYHLFRNISYQPETLGQLIYDMDLKNEMIINGVYVNHSFYKIDPVKVWEYLLSNEDCENCGRESAPCDYGISVDIPTLGRRNIAINVYSNGFISTNIADSGVRFNIGTKNVQAFIDYVNQYGILIEGNASEMSSKSPEE
ncbi:hypothetical protein [uncultured Ruminococcus sp.]|uniref:hypothetical protein n=1 Tax=uncultured Ruminococcus sp. TaxID=165186 RepID=UPI00260BA442|nr:hypothetical protein [uncultured Ruminococcus sp.]